MKRFFILLLAAVLLGSVSAFAQSGNNDPLRGDLNKDGVVDVGDINAIIEIMKYGWGSTTSQYYWYVGNEIPSSVDTNNIKSSQTEIGWHEYDPLISTIEVGQCVASSSSYWYVLIPVINNYAFRKVFSSGEDITSLFDVSRITIDGQEYTLFAQIETTKRFLYTFSK